MPSPNYLAVLVAAIAVFMLGGLWYSKLMFADKWVALQGKTVDSMKAEGQGGSPGMFVQVFICGFLIAWGLALFIQHTGANSVFGGVHMGALAWLAFVAPTSYGTALFSYKPKALWAIDCGYNLVAMLIAGAILGAWH